MQSSENRAFSGSSCLEGVTKAGKAESLDILVTGADQRQGLAVIRSLGRRGMKVLAAGENQRSVGFRSRYAAATWLYPSPYGDPDDFIDSLLQAIQRYQIRMVFPVVESTLVVINRYRTKIETEAAVVAASKEAVDLSMNKDRQFQIAEDLGIRVPKTIVPDNLKDAMAEVEQLSFPLVLKANIKSEDEGLAEDILKVCYAQDKETLRNLLSIYYRAGVIPIIQELVFGEGLGCGVLMDHDKPLCCYQYHRGRENHPTGGVPVRYHSMPMWPELREQSVRLLQEMEWHGVAQVEWKNIIGTREIVLMEVNGRFWASLPGAIHAGMDFPAWLYDLWVGKEVMCPMEYPVPVVSRFLTGDARRLEIIFGLDDAVSSVPLASKRRESFRFIADIFNWRVHSDVFSWSDPLPGFLEMGILARKYLKLLLKMFVSLVTKR